VSRPAEQNFATRAIAAVTSLFLKSSIGNLEYRMLFDTFSDTLADSRTVRTPTPAG
jgi:hypothetical protein